MTQGGGGSSYDPGGGSSYDTGQGGGSSYDPGQRGGSSYDPGRGEDLHMTQGGGRIFIGPIAGWGRIFI